MAQQNPHRAGHPHRGSGQQPIPEPLPSGVLLDERSGVHRQLHRPGGGKPASVPPRQVVVRHQKAVERPLPQVDEAEEKGGPKAGALLTQGACAKAGTG